MAPGLVAAEPGLGPLSAAQLLLSWSHAGRIRSEAAFAMLSGTAPIPVSSGRTDRHRLNRLGDRQLNRALHMIAVTRMRCHPATLAYVQRCRAEGKTDWENALLKIADHGGMPLASGFRAPSRAGGDAVT
jgi:transposase